MIVKPRSLQQGDVVAVLSLSSGAAHLFPHIFDNGLQVIRNLGFSVREYETTRASQDFLSANPELRARDLNSALADDSVQAVIASIGGNDSVRLLPYIDFDLSLKSPKVIMGYSDSTAYLTALAHRGLVTFNGPSVMAGFSQAGALEPAFINHVREFLSGVDAGYRYPMYARCSHGYPDWREEENVGLVKDESKNPGPRLIQGSGSSGQLFGGCLAVLKMVNGTPYWPDPQFFEHRMLFIETSENVPRPYEMEYTLRNYGAQGILERINALLIGRPRDYTQEMKDELEGKILDVCKEFGRSDLSVAVDMNFGHSDPQVILPHNIRVELGSDCSLTLLESPYQ